MYLKEDLISSNRKLTYARQGDYCTIINRRGNVLICELENGSRFTCLEDHLTETKPKTNVESTIKHKRKG